MMEEDQYRQLDLQKLPPDKWGNLTIRHMYAYCKDDIKEEVSIRESLFTKIIKVYLRKVMKCIIEKKREVNFPQNFGKMFLAKILCTRFNPVRFQRALDIDSYDGYFHFIAWDREGDARRTKMYMSRIWKKEIMKDMGNGGDCIDITNIVNE